MKRRTILLGWFCLVSLFILLAGNQVIAGSSGKDIRPLYHKHKVYLQEKALVDFGPRVAGGEVEKAAAAHIAEEMKRIGIEVEMQSFEMFYFEEVSPPQLEQVSPNPILYEEAVDFATMGYSGSGTASAPVQAVDLDMPPSGDSSSGCEPEDFLDFIPGNIALIQRGTCTFAQKANNAAAAGAVGAIIFNEGNTPERTELLMGTLGEPGISIPVVGTTFALGQDLAQLLPTDEVVVNLMVDAISELRSSQNVIGTLSGDKSDQGVVYLGGHYDSVAAGPGANDDASGVAAMLEAARVLKKKSYCIPVTLKFIAFGAEETGLDGSYNYVDANFDEVSTKGLGMINLDMIGVGDMLQIGHIGYEGGSGPELVEYTQQIATNWGLIWETFEAQENSDHTYFEQAGIPTVFLTQREDPNYHTAEDTIDKIQFDTLEDNGELAAEAMLGWAQNPLPESPETQMLFKQPDTELEKLHVHQDIVYVTK